MDVEALRASGEYLTRPDGHRVWYRYVPGSGTPVVLLHGVGGSSYPMRPLAEPTRATGRPILIVDLLNHGFTDAAADGACDLETYTDDVLAVVRHLELPRAAFVGHCLGGSIAVHIAHLHPELVGSLALLSVDMRPNRGFFDRLGWGSLQVLAGAIRVFAPRWYSGRVPEQWDCLRFTSHADVHLARMLGDYRHTSIAAVAATLRTMASADLEAIVPALSCPTLVMHGKRDSFLHWKHAKRLASRIPGARFVLRERANHVDYILDAKSGLPEELRLWLTDGTTA